MKARWPFILCAFLSVLVTLISIQPPRAPSAKTAILLLGYTNRAGAFMAVLQVTNRTPSTFHGLVGPRAVRFRGRREIWCASTHVLPSRGSFTFTVPVVPNAKGRRVSVQLIETKGWHATLASVLRRFGIRAIECRNYRLVSPPFFGPASEHDTLYSQQPPSLPFSEVQGDSPFSSFGDAWSPAAVAERDR